MVEIGSQMLAALSLSLQVIFILLSRKRKNSEEILFIELIGVTTNVLTNLLHYGYHRHMKSLIGRGKQQ
ncbi:hypothetical protein PALU110988_23070 [Paenibacillus lupini]|nr:hypothetical protein [Paenibacillus lupini]